MRAGSAVLVTGAAKRLGAIVARRLAREGWRVVIHCGRSRDAAEALAHEIGAAGVVSGDLADGDAVDTLFADARGAAGGAIAGLVNSASRFAFDAPPAIDMALVEDLNRINFGAPVRLAALLARQADLAEGAVVNLLDQKLWNLNPDYFSYTASKASLAAATTMLSQAFGPRIAVNAVAPGITLPSGGQSEAEFRAVASGNILRRPVDPEDVAEAVAFVLGARGVTGQTLHVDCGQRFVASSRDVMFAGGAAHG